LGQFFVEPDGAEPVEPLGGVVVVDPEGLVVELLPDAAVVGVVLELVLDVLVAALATSAPPPMRPLVSAPAASALRSRSFMGNVLLSSMAHGPPRFGECLSLCGFDLWVGP
jgi:hypothetical protein